MKINKQLFNCCVGLLIIAAAMANAQSKYPAGGAKELELIAVLKSDAPKAEKAITCKRLAIYGTDKCIEAVVPLVADKELSSWARITLEAIPGDAADKALRDTMSKVKGRLLVGVINSIAVRRDQLAVKALTIRLKDSDVDVASAAAVALGSIGGQKAAVGLIASLADAPDGVRSAVAEGCIICAEHFLADNNNALAVKLYDAVRKADVSDQRHLEAIRGAILARGSAGVPLLIEQLESKDDKRLGIGLRTARELPGKKVTEALAAELTKLNPDRQPLLLLAIADRKDSAVLPTVTKAATSNSKDLRLTAINILIDLGDVTCVPILLQAATDSDDQLQKAATETLIRLPGKDIDSDLVARLPKAKGKQLRVLIEVAGQRQIASSLGAVVSRLKNSDAGIRAAAVGTIAILGQHQHTPDLVQLLLKTDSSTERASIRKALLAICGRSGTECIPHLKPLTQSKDNQLHIMGLRAMAVVGGTDALAAVNAAIATADPALNDEAVRILSTWPNNWPDDAAAGKALLKFAGSAEKMSHQVLALRGYLQYVRGTKTLNNQQKVAEVKNVLDLSKRPEEKRVAVAVLGEAPCADSLDMLTTLAKDPALTEEAYSAIVLVAARNIPGVSKDQRKQLLQTVIQKTKNNGTKQRAQKALGEIR